MPRQADSEPPAQPARSHITLDSRIIMGFFSRKDRSSKVPPKPSLTTSQSKISIDSGHSSIKSPSGTLSSRAFNRSSAGTNHTSAPNTPLSPFSPHAIPKMELPKGPDPDLDPAGYLRSIGSVRERARVITTKAIKNELNHFDVDMSKFPEVVSFVASIIKVCSVAIKFPRFCNL